MWTSPGSYKYGWSHGLFCSAGHYAPNLAKQIILHNERAGSSQIKLKGFLIGNPWTDAYYDNKGAVDFWYYHSLISDATYDAIQDNCDYRSEPAVGYSNNLVCQTAANQASGIDMAEINAYNIYAGNCNTPNSSTVLKVQIICTSPILLCNCCKC